MSNSGVCFPTGILSLGGLNVDIWGRLFYIDMNKNIQMLLPTDIVPGLETPVTNTGDVCCGLTVHRSGVVLFYIDEDDNLIQKACPDFPSVYSGTLVNSTAFPAMALAKNETRLYFVGKDDGDIYRCDWSPTGPVTGGVKKLGTEAECNQHDYSVYPIQQGWISISNNDDLVYYWNQDGHIWYYYHDQDPDGARENWYTTPLNYAENSQGPMAFEPYGLGQLFYIGEDNKLYVVDYADADNPVSCPDIEWHAPIASFKTDEEENSNEKTDTVITKKPGRDTSEKAFGVNVFPNPSSGLFSIFISGLDNASVIDIRIQGTDGRTVYSNTNLSSGRLMWDATKVNVGVYYYQIKTDNGETANGKIVKI